MENYGHVEARLPHHKEVVNGLVFEYTSSDDIPNLVILLAEEKRIKVIEEARRRKEAEIQEARRKEEEQLMKIPLYRRMKEVFL